MQYLFQPYSATTQTRSVFTHSPFTNVRATIRFVPVFSGFQSYQ